MITLQRVAVMEVSPTFQNELNVSDGRNKDKSQRGTIP
jgi:hypothetical protein